MCGFEMVAVWSCADESVGGVVCVDVCACVCVCVWKCLLMRMTFMHTVRGSITSIWDIFLIALKQARRGKGQDQSDYLVPFPTQSQSVRVFQTEGITLHTLHRFQRSTHAQWIHLLSNQSIERWWIMPKTANFFAVVKHEQWVVWSSHKNVTVWIYMCVNLSNCQKETERGKGRQAKSRLIGDDVESRATSCSLLIRKEMLLALDPISLWWSFLFLSPTMKMIIKCNKWLFRAGEPLIAHKWPITVHKYKKFQVSPVVQPLNPSNWNRYCWSSMIWFPAGIQKWKL